MFLAPGARLGPYEVLSAIGAGGMGEVYKARDTRLDRTVAIKVLPAQVASDPDLRQRFEREARAVAALNHPHICTLYDVGHQDGIDFLVMEYLEGQTLAERLEKGALPLEQALQYAIQVADALDKAHRQGITHRDLKPGNIMVTKSGAKLMDFGLAKFAPAAPAGMAGLTVAATLSAPLTVFSPDGRWLVYVSDESGRDEVYVRSYAESGQKIPVSTEGGTDPVWSRNGRELFYRNGDSLMAASLVLNWFEELKRRVPSGR